MIANISKHLDKYLLLVIKNYITVWMDDDGNKFMQFFPHVCISLFPQI